MNMSLTSIVRKLASVLGFVGVAAAASEAVAQEPPTPPTYTHEEIDEALKSDQKLKQAVDKVNKFLSPTTSSSSADLRNKDGSLINPEATLRRLITYSEDAQKLLQNGWKLDFDYNPGGFWSGEHFSGRISHPHGLDYQISFGLSNVNGKWKTDNTTGIPDDVLKAFSVPLHTKAAEFKESRATASRAGFVYYGPDRCESVRTNAPRLSERYSSLWSSLDSDLRHHLTRADEITNAQLQMYVSQVDALRAAAQTQIGRIGGLQKALLDAEKLRPQLENRGKVLGTEVGFSCVEPDQDLASIEKSLGRTELTARQIRETLMAHKAIIANYLDIHKSKLPLVEELKAAKDYAAIREVVARIGDYAQALPGWTDELASNSGTAGARAAPPKERTATTYSSKSTSSRLFRNPSSTSSSTALTELTLVLDADKIPTATGQDIINDSYRFAADHPQTGKSLPRTAYRSPMTQTWVGFKGEDAKKAAKYTSVNLLDAIIEEGRSTDFSGTGRCDALEAVGKKTQALFNNGRYHGPFRIADVQVKGGDCENGSTVKQVTTPTEPTVLPEQPKDDKVKPGEVDPTIPIIPINDIPGATPTQNDLDTLMKTYTAHTNAFSNGMLNPQLYVANIRFSMSNGNQYVTQEGRLARAILGNEGGLVHKYTDRIADIMEVVAETNDARVLGEIKQALAEAAGRSYVRRTSRVLAQVAGAALAVEQKQKAVVSTLENNVGAGSGPEPLTPDNNKFGTARYKADAAIDNLHSALMTDNYDLAGRLTERMSSRQIVKAELEMNRSYALTDDQKVRYGSFFETAETSAKQRETYVRAEAREREYAENFTELAHGAGMKQHRLYNEVRAALINGNVDYAFNVLQSNNLLNVKDLTPIETGIDGSQLTAARRARIAHDVEGFEKLAAMTTAPQGPATAQVIALPQRTYQALDRKAA